MHREWFTCCTLSTGMAMGHRFAQTPQSRQLSSWRWMRARAKREKGFNTAANGHNQRQNGTVSTRDANMIAALIT
jgi:hypothetical protein